MLHWLLEERAPGEQQGPFSGLCRMHAQSSRGPEVSVHSEGGPQGPPRPPSGDSSSLGAPGGPAAAQQGLGGPPSTLGGAPWPSARLLPSASAAAALFAMNSEAPGALDCCCRRAGGPLRVRGAL